MSYNPTKPYKNQVLKLIQETWRTPYISVRKGAYPIFIRKFNYPEVDHTDGIGPKGIFHWQRKTFHSAVLDALAMNLNDLAMARAVPYKLQCHLILPEDNKKIVLAIMKHLVRECKKRKIAITGGETSIQNNFKGLDISLTVSGFVKKDKKNMFLTGDVLVGLASNGLHSNGFTTVRKVLGNSFSDELTKPTKIYFDCLHELDNKYNVHGMMHITGGAFTKLKGLLLGADAIITSSHSLNPQSIFRNIYSCKVSDIDMYKTFNYGLGFILSTSRSDAFKIVSRVKGAEIVGRVVSGTGKVKITSMFSGKDLSL